MSEVTYAARQQQEPKVEIFPKDVLQRMNKYVVEFWANTTDALTICKYDSWEDSVHKNNRATYMRRDGIRSTSDRLIDVTGTNPGSIDLQHVDGETKKKTTLDWLPRTGSELGHLRTHGCSGQAENWNEDPCWNDRSNKSLTSKVKSCIQSLQCTKRERSVVDLGQIVVLQVATSK